MTDKARAAAHYTDQLAQAQHTPETDAFRAHLNNCTGPFDWYSGTMADLERAEQMCLDFAAGFERRLRAIETEARRLRMQVDLVRADYMRDRVRMKDVVAAETDRDNLKKALEGIFAQTAKHSRQWGQASSAHAFAADPDTAKAFAYARAALKGE